MVNSSKIELVIFDLFGTLIKYGVMHHPFRQLLKFARENGRPVGLDDARYLMTTNASLQALSLKMGFEMPQQFLEKLQIQLDEELASLTLFDEVTDVLSTLHGLGVPIAICSNLAQPYGVVIPRLLAQFHMHLFLSYEVGFIKPEPEIYQRIFESTKIERQACLFVGDTYIADYEGPIQNGFQARHLIRNQTSRGHMIGSLVDVLSMVQHQPYDGHRSI